MSKQLSGKVHGLKFMQRGAARAAADAGDVQASTEAEPAASTDTDVAEHWEVPASARVAVKPAHASTTHWDAWLTSALEHEPKHEKPVVRREVYGQWKKAGPRHAESEDEMEESGPEDPAHNAPAFQRPPGANTPRKEKRRAPNQVERQRKVAAVASPHDSHRKKPGKKSALRKER